MLKRFTGSIREFKTVTLLTPLIIAGEAIIDCLIPYAMAELINQIKAGCEFEVLLKYGGILLAMAFVSLFFGAAAGLTAARASTGFARNLRRDIYYRVQTFTFENIDRFSASSLVTRMTTDVSNVQMAFMMIIRIAVRAPLMFIFSIIMAYIMGGALATMFVVVVPLLGFGLFLISKFTMPAFRRVFGKYDTLNESIAENVRAARTVKGFVREEYEKQKFAAAAEGIRRDFTRAERIVALSNPLMQICFYFNMVFVLLVGSKLVITGRGQNIDVGQLSAMLTYGAQILFSLMSLAAIYVMITISATSARRIAEVLDEEPAMKNPENPKTVVPDGSVEFAGVSFKYSERAERPTLSDINLKIKSGETIGILGGTGSGKSTLVQLIPRLYDVTEGSVLVGGIDVRRYDIAALRGQVSMVLQKNLLFSGTIKDNLRWGNENATDEELHKVCKFAMADGFVSSFPQGYNTVIEQGGTNVSGGQRQRLCIARALLKRPKILILDDSTSAVDTRTDAQIRKNFREYMPETTKIIIAQRVASVMDADRIIVMDGGRIVACGTHDELLKSSEIYHEIYSQQIKGGEDHVG
ncbi:MAG: ABC transporter ATP-binding protein [Eubacteriales bacterium]|jgi:ATP-binding cassette subfamily B protein